MQARDRVRCAWAGEDPALRAYHDREWGRPVRRDRKLFEMLVLEGAQAGLSWLTVLRKREGYRRAFRGFDPVAVAAMRPREVERLLRDASIVRNRAKIESTVQNARVVLAIREEAGTFTRFVWGFVDGSPIVNRWSSGRQVPATDGRAQALSRELRRRGMRFVGPTICYAFMQATGMVNDHTTDCFLWGELAARARQSRERKASTSPRRS